MLNNSFDTTRVWCSRCEAPHDAHFFERAGKMMLQSICPQTGVRESIVSSDVALFQALRRKHRIAPPQTRTKTQIHHLHITDTCSLGCPICFAESSAKRTGHITLEDLRFRAGAIRRDAGHFVTLTGGEPTEHPEILEIIRILAREFHLKPSITTNGLRLSKDRAFAQACKQAGLNKIHLSFDTLSGETSRLMRGKDLVAAKQTALDHARQAGIAASLIMTVCSANIAETGEIARFAMSRAPQVNLLILQPFQAVGRNITGVQSCDRETIMHALADSGVIPALMCDDFLPSPTIPMTGLCVHPDCGALLPVIVRQGEEPRLWNREPGFDELLAALNALPPANRFRAQWHSLRALFRHSGWRGVRRVLNWATARGKETCLMIVVDSFMNPEQQDCERAARCATRRCEKDGSMRPLCASYTPGGHP